MATSSLRSLSSGVLAVAAAGVLALLVPAAVATQADWRFTPARHQPAVPTLQDCNNHLIHSKVLRPGQCVIVVAGGFAAAEPVRTRLLSTAAQSGITRADTRGVLHLRMQISRTAKAGPDVLTMTGLGASRSQPAGSGNISVSVPRTAVLRYRVG